jgi:hypothetical protein
VDYAAENSPEPQGSVADGEGNESFSSSEISGEGIETGGLDSAGEEGGETEGEPMDTS